MTGFRIGHKFEKGVAVGRHMRTTIATTILLAFALFAGSAQAADECGPYSTGSGLVRAGVSDCEISIVAFEDLTCVGDWGNSFEAAFAGHSATVYHCLGQYTFGFPLPGQSVCDIADCPVVVEPFGGCIGGGGQVHERTVGPLHVKLLMCEPQNPLPPTS